MKNRIISNLASLNLIDDQNRFSRLSPRFQEKLLFQLDWILRIKAC